MDVHGPYERRGHYFGQTGIASMTSSRFIHRKLQRIGQNTDRATPIIASM